MVWNNIKLGILLTLVAIVIFVLVTVVKPLLIVIAVGTIVGLICSALGIDLGEYFE